MVEQPSLAAIWLLVEQLVPVAANIATTQWGGRHGHLKMVLGRTKYRAVLSGPTVAIEPIPKPNNAATIATGATPSAIEDTRAAHKILWREFFLQQAIDAAGVATIAKSADDQYVAALKKDYVGFAGVLMYQLLKHLRT